MVESRERFAIIDCRDPGAFVRAHLHALHRGETSVMTGGSTDRLLSCIAADYPHAIVYTDRPTAAWGTFRNQVESVLDLPERTAIVHPADDAGAAVFFTSGSTGDPKSIWKNWRTLRGEATAIAGALDLQNCSRAARVITTVPLEHMYGYMFGLLVPLLHGLRINMQRVVLAGDLDAALRSSDDPALVVTTPAHSRLYTAGNARYTNVLSVISGAGPLDLQLANATTAAFAAPVSEFYGSTETGAIACRRWQLESTDAPAWNCLAGITLARDHESRPVVFASHISKPITLSDMLDLKSPTSFHIEGRDAEIVKVAGKRASLSTLNSHLLAVPGVRDGTFYAPAERDADALTRLVAFVALDDGATEVQVVQHLRKCIDAVFLPRPVIKVAALPRNATGKLSHDSLRAFFDGSLHSRNADATGKASPGGIR